MMGEVVVFTWREIAAWVALHKQNRAELDRILAAIAEKEAEGGATNESIARHFRHAIQVAAATARTENFLQRHSADLRLLTVCPTTGSFTPN